MTDFKRVFIDTAPIIYYIDENENFGKKVLTLIEEFLNKGSELVTSAITCEEYLVYAYRINSFIHRQAFYGFLNECCTQIIPVDIIVADKAAKIRAEYTSFKAMDSLQLAAAATSGCDMFLTNDKQLRRFKEIKCLTIDDFDM